MNSQVSGDVAVQKDVVQVLSAIQGARFGDRMSLATKAYLRRESLGTYEVFGANCATSGGSGVSDTLRSAITGIDIKPGSNLLVCAGLAQPVTVWDTRATSDFDQWQSTSYNSNDCIWEAFWGPCGHIYSLCAYKSVVDVHHPARQEKKHSLVAEPTNIGPFKGLAFPGDNLIAAANDRGQVYFWDMRGRQRAGILNTHGLGGIAALEATPDGRLVIAGHSRGVISCWDMRGGRGPPAFGAKGLQTYNMVDKIEIYLQPWQKQGYAALDGLHLDPMDPRRISFVQRGGAVLVAGCLDLARKKVTHLHRTVPSAVDLSDAALGGWARAGKAAWTPDGHCLICIPRDYRVLALDFRDSSSPYACDAPLEAGAPNPDLEWKFKCRPLSIAVNHETSEVYIGATNDPFSRGERHMPMYATPYAHHQCSS